MDNKILKLIEEWEFHLENSSGQMLTDIRNILSDEKPRQGIAAFYFEYEFEYMDIIFRAEDRDKRVIDMTVLPTRKGNKTFLPETIWTKEQELDADDYDKYDREKRGLFEKWFCNCWKIVMNEMECIPDAYFSIHDTNWLTDLKTGKRMSRAEISGMEVRK